MQWPHPIPGVQILARIFRENPDLLHRLGSTATSKRFGPVRRHQHQRPSFIKAFNHCRQKLCHRGSTGHHDCAGTPRRDRPTECEKTCRSLLEVTPYFYLPFHPRQHLQQDRISRSATDHEFPHPRLHQALNHLHRCLPTVHAPCLAVSHGVSMTFWGKDAPTQDLLFICENRRGTANSLCSSFNR